LEVRVKLIHTTPWLAAIAFVTAGAAQAQVPPDIAKQLVTIGRGVCVPETSKLYLPLHSKPPYPGISISRDVKFGPDGMDVLDVFSPEKGSGNRPVLIYISGGAGNKLGGGPEGIFYDNIMLWAVKNGMVGVNVQRHAGYAADDYYGPAKSIGMAVEWVRNNIAKHKGNPARVLTWSQSAGNQPVANYIGHSDLYGPNGVGLKGAVFMSSPGFSILPATPPQAQGGNGGPCNDPVTGQPSAGGRGGPGGGGPGGGGAARGTGGGRGTGGAAARGTGGGGGRGRGQVDEATLLARSDLAGLVSSKLPFIVSSAELDPPGVIAFAETLRDALTKAGRAPLYLTFKDHSHISEVEAVNTKDVSVTGPILKWMKSVK
jgi:hypothetical protein